MPEKTAKEFSADGWFKTGDVGKIDAPATSPDHRRAQQGPDHQRRLQRLPGRDRGRAQRDARRRRERGDRRAACRLRRGRRRGRRRARRCQAGRRGADRRAQVADRQLQGAQARVHRRRAAAQRHGQGAEEPAARAAQGAVRPPPRGGVFFCGLNVGGPGAGPTPMLPRAGGSPRREKRPFSGFAFRKKPSGKRKAARSADRLS